MTKEPGVIPRTLVITHISTGHVRVAQRLGRQKLRGARLGGDVSRHCTKCWPLSCNLTWRRSVDADGLSTARLLLCNSVCG